MTLCEYQHCMPRVASVDIRAFRGVPGRLRFDLRVPSGESASVVLLGDNGSGKSSLADALEFCLRASLLRRIDPARPVKRQAQSLVVKAPPYVEVTLDDGTRVARGGPGKGRFSDGVVRLGNEPHEAFALAPFVLRRADIQSFWALPAKERMLAFFDYFRPPGATEHEKLVAASRIPAIEARIAKFESPADRGLTDLAHTLGVPAEAFGALETFKEREAKIFARFMKPALSAASTKREVNALKATWRKARNPALALASARSELEVARATAAGNSADRVKAEVSDILSRASATVSESFGSISMSGFVEQVVLGPGPDGSSLDVELTLADGTSVDPSVVLSEANLDLLALLVFVGVLEAAADAGQAKLVVLDDVFQSVDAVHRERVCAYLVERLSEWQVIILTHDRLWMALLSEILRSRGHRFVAREVTSWTFDGGPVIREALLAPDAPVRLGIESEIPTVMCSATGLLLEEISERLSWTLPSSVVRRRGDRYTLGDTWPGVSKRIKKLGLDEEALAVEGSLALRNLVGAHFNEWARGISLAEAQRFGEAALALYDAVHCQDCGQWVRAMGDGRYACTCGSTALPPIASDEA